MPANDDKHAVTISAQARTRVAPARAFDLVMPIDLPSIMLRSGPLPGVAAIREQSGSWDAAGRTRIIELTDGSTMRETIVEHDPGHSFAYRLTELTGLLGALARDVRGEWSFTPDRDGAIIRWTWEITPKRGRAQLVRFGVAPLMRCNMTAACRRTARACETAE